MSAVAAPYGIRPVELLGGRFYNHAFRQIQIASGYTNTAGGIGLFDPVTITSSGVINKVTALTGATNFAIGIFMGLSYTDPNTKQPTYKSFYPAAGITNATSNDIFAFVADDPDLVFQAQADGTLAYTALGMNVQINSTFAVTATEVSTSPILTVTASSNSYPVLTQGIFPGMIASGTGIVVGSTVVGVTATTVTLNQNASASASNTVTFQGPNTIGNSMLSLNAASVATTNTFPIRIVDFVRGPTSLAPLPGTAGDAFTDVLCMWNWGAHVYRNALGV